MWHFFNCIQSLLFHHSIQIAHNMIKTFINLTIRFRLFPIKLFVIFIQHMWHTNFTGWDFQIVSNLFITNYDKTILFRWWQIFILPESFFSSSRIELWIAWGKCIKLRQGFFGFFIRLMLRNVRSNNVFIFFDSFKQLFGLFNRVKYMWGI